MSNYVLRYAGDSALAVEFDNEISIKTNRHVQSLMNELEHKRPDIAGMLELVPSYRTLLVHYDPLTTNLEGLQNAIAECAQNLNDSGTHEATVTEIPVLYNGLDLEEIARLERKSVDEVIRIHSQSEYYVYMLGFAPGHPYTARFENPFSFKRRETPRVRIDAGSIVVQLDLSDIIPFEQPCGWNIIGNTPLVMCDYSKANPFMLKAGQWIKYVPISQSEFDAIRREVSAGTYKCRTYAKEAHDVSHS